MRSITEPTAPQPRASSQIQRRFSLLIRENSSEEASLAVWAFYIQVAVPMRLPDAGRLMGSNLPHAGLGPMTSECCSEHYVAAQLGYEMACY